MTAPTTEGRVTRDHRIVCVGHCCSFHDTPVDPELPARIEKLAAEWTAIRERRDTTENVDGAHAVARLDADRRLREVLGESK